MKRKPLQVLFLAAGIAVSNFASAQLFIDQATFTIQSGATVTVQGNVTSNVDIQGTGKVILKGSANQDVNMNGFTVPNVEIDNTSGVTLTGAAKVSGTLTFTNGNVSLGNNNLTLTSATPATAIAGAASTKFVVTNGTGKLVKTALSTTAFTYPVGKATTSYTPLAISNSGTADDIGVRAFDKVYSGGGTAGTAFTKEVVNTTWDVSEAAAGNSNLSLTATWNAADTLLGFNRTRTGISYYIPTAGATQGWDLLNSQTTAATGAGPFTVSRSGFTSVGSFAVGVRPVLSALLVSPKIFLQGPFNTGTSRMSDALRTNNLIPFIEPYSSAIGGNLLSLSNATRGSGGGETSTKAVVGSDAGAATDNTIVDWVLVQLHNGAGTVISQRAALLQRDGDVVDVDGTSAVNLAGNAAGSYFISVKHRNHLGIRSAATFALAKTTTTAYDFTDNLSKALGGVATNNAMIVATASPSTIYSAFSGNANSDLTTRKSGPSAINDYSLLLAGINATLNYYRADFNMDGKVTKTGPAAANDYSRFLTNFTGLASAIITQPTF